MHNIKYYNKTSIITYLIINIKSYIKHNVIINTKVYFKTYFKLYTSIITTFSIIYITKDYNIIYIKTDNKHIVNIIVKVID